MLSPSPTKGLTTRTLTSYGLLTTFITTFLFLGLLNRVSDTFRPKRPTYNFPDFDKVKLKRVLDQDLIDITHPNDRVIFIGDVHGMNESLHHLLHKLSYNPQHDTILFAGDLLAKSSHETSLSVIDFLTKHNTAVVDGALKERIFPVRGNHDHMVVQWRAWREWFETLRLPAPAAPSILSSFNPLSESFGTIPLFLGEGPTEVPPVYTGKEFLQLIEDEWVLELEREKGADPEEYVEVARKRARGTWREVWWHRIPKPRKGRTKQMWRMFGDHYWLARDLTTEQAEYLVSLPLINHIPHFHAFIVHAGLLPSNPRLKPTDERQPLAHRPDLVDVGEKSLAYDENADRIMHSRLAAQYAQYGQQQALDTAESFEPSTDPAKNGTITEEALRRLQEFALIDEVPQNQDPWSVLNMRGVKKDGKVTRNGHKGTPWSKIWNEQMSRCEGYDEDLGLAESSDPEAQKGKYTLPCRPSTVVYGHAATRNLDVKRWSMGLDTGCLYGGKLTAMVVTRPDRKRAEVEEGDELKKKKLPVVKFGDRKAGFQADLVQIRCPDMG